MRALRQTWHHLVSACTLISGIACSGTSANVASGGGASSSGGSPNAGGNAAGGAAQTGGASFSTGGNSAPNTSTATGGTPATGGAAGGSSAGTGGKATGGVSTAATGGKATGGAAAATGGATVTTGCGAVNNNPFNCKFAWGAASSGTNYNSLNFVSTWIGDETNAGLGSWSATATNSGASSACGDCALVKNVASTSSMVVFYTYIIGFQACKQSGYCDCNTSSGATLCTNGAQWIRNNRAIIVNAYGQYAKAVYANSPNKPVIWWLEGDFVQYTVGGGTTQTSALSYAEAGQLARDITCAIKSNEPNAIVAMNHSPWNADAVSQGFWSAMPNDVLDLIWVQGPGDSDTLTNSGTYNATTANYKWLHTYTGLKIMAETSFAGSGAADRWSTTTAANINARIANGVIGVHVNAPSSSYTSALGTLNPSLSSTCN